MYDGSPASLELGVKHGIPPRTPASVALWAHLLRKDPLPPAPDSGIVLPPVTPLDKNGTSMRILLHDTQAHLDKFSAKVDALCKSADSSKQEISTVHTLFQREHETLTTELVDLVNRSQTQLQAAIGSPAQAQESERLFKNLSSQLESLEKHVDAVDKRIDAFQAFNQTHSQTLQLQSQALQSQSEVLHSLQEQQGKVIAALMPLLPLLQALPLHIELARNTVTDHISKTIDPLLRPHTHDISKRVHKRLSSNPVSDCSPSLPLKKARMTLDPEPSGCLTSLNEPKTNADTLGTPTRASSDIYNFASTLNVSPPALTAPSPLVAPGRKSNTGLDIKFTHATDAKEGMQSSCSPRPDNGDTLSLTSKATGDCGKEPAVGCPAVDGTPAVDTDSPGTNVAELGDRPYSFQAETHNRPLSVAPIMPSSPSRGLNTGPTPSLPRIYENNLSLSTPNILERSQKQIFPPSTLNSVTRSLSKVQHRNPLLFRSAKENDTSPIQNTAVQQSPQAATSGRQIQHDSLVPSQRPLRTSLISRDRESSGRHVNPTPQTCKPLRQDSILLQSSHSPSLSVLKWPPVQAPRRFTEIASLTNSKGRPLHVQREGRRFIPLSDSDDEDDGCDGNK